MSAVVDTSPYPWMRRDAQELHVVLCETYPTSRGATFVAQKAGLNPAMLNTDQSAFFLWKDILEAGAPSKKNRKLVELVVDQNPDNPRTPFLDGILANQTEPTGEPPRRADGSPMFLKSNDTVSEPEALLYHDDLTLPIGRVPWLIGVLQRLIAIAPSVCRVETTIAGDRKRGTAFRIADDLLLTNWHVTHFGDALDTPTAQMTAEFGFEDDGQGGATPSTVVACDVATLKGQKADDWSVVRVSAPLAGTVPIVRLSTAAAPAVNAPAFIIQHPGGERKRLAYVRNQITDFDDQVVHYLSDTQYGSSGAPVIDDGGRLIALHHSGGRPQEVAGKPPLKKNEGIRVSRVVAGLGALGIAVP